MSFTVADVILEARDFHPAFTDRQTPNVVAVRAVNRHAGDLYSDIAARDRAYFTQVEAIAMPLAVFANGYTLTGNVHMPLSGDVYLTEALDSPLPLGLVPYGNRYSPKTSWPAYLRGDVLHLIGIETDWSGVDHIDFAYIPQRTQLTLSTDTPALPDEAKKVLVDRLALFMAARGPQGTVGEGPIQINLEAADVRDDVERFLKNIGGRRRVAAKYVREVW